MNIQSILKKETLNDIKRTARAIQLKPFYMRWEVRNQASDKFKPEIFLWTLDWKVLTKFADDYSTQPQCVHAFFLF